MNIDGARQVLLIRAIEESDTEHGILDRATRERATREARSSAADTEAMLCRRAEILCRHLEAAHARLRPILRGVRAGFGAAGFWSWMAIAGAVAVWMLVSGVSKGLWAADKSINILIVPLLLLFVWNMFFFSGKCVLFVWALVRRGGSRQSLLNKWISAIGLHRLTVIDRISEQLASHENKDAARWRAALTKFAASWAKLAQPLYAARIRFALHVAACALVAGEFFYVYVKGVSVQFVATWESTWFSAETTHDVLSVLLWPMSEGLPSATEIGQLKNMPSNAAYWINLYLAQACIVVFLPRLFLSAVEYVRVLRLERALPLALDDRYYQNLVHADRGQGIVARVVPYSFHVSTKTRDTIHELLADDLGHSAHIEIEESIPYGAVEPPVQNSPSDASPTERVVLLFNLAQTPESEVQGRFIGNIAQAASTHGEPIAIMVDATAYSDRLVGESQRAARLDERRAAWQDLAQQNGLGIYFLNMPDHTPESIHWNILP